MRKLLKLLGALLASLLVLAIIGAGGALYLLHRYGSDLPDYRQLADYQPPTVTRIHAADGRLMAEYAHEKRIFVPVEAIPRRLIQAFLAAEDKNFYSHPGVDPLSIVRAAFTNLGRLGDDRRPVGASTITQQVAKNFLLSGEVSLRRKVKEALLAFRIERAFTKDQILELYLNQIYLGVGSYGVAAAALNYFDKSLDELTVAEAAFLAGLPKAPSWYHPVRQPEAAKARRDWVIGRMLDLGFITPADAEQAMAEPLVMRHRAPTELVTADYFTEEVRRQLVEEHGEAFLYQGGLSIRTTLSPTLQAVADRALRDGLVAYDRRHGWRGPEARLEGIDDWPSQLAELDHADGRPSWQLAVVLETAPEGATIGLGDGSRAELPLSAMAWARPALGNNQLGPEVTAADQVVRPGDVVWVEPLAADDAAPGAPPRYALRQPPEVEGAVVALDPHNGRVLAMSGGFSYARSVFNRATQALRQPGSALKPFVYLAGLESGFTPSSILLDAPIVIDQGPGLGKWKPINYSGHFYGPSTLRLGIEKSRNLMTVRLAQATGMDRVVDMVHRFGIDRGHGAQSGLRARRRRGRPDEPHHRLRRAGQRRQADQAGADRAHSGSSRQDHRAARRSPVPGMPGCRLAGAERAAPDRSARAGDPAAAWPTRWSTCWRAWSSAAPACGRARSTSRSPARPAPRTTAATPGSSASRRIWWSASTSASISRRASVPRSRAPRRRCRCSSRS